MQEKSKATEDAGEAGDYQSRLPTTSKLLAAVSSSAVTDTADIEQPQNVQPGVGKGEVDATIEVLDEDAEQEKMAVLGSSTSNSTKMKNGKTEYFQHSSLEEQIIMGVVEDKNRGEASGKAVKEASGGLAEASEAGWQREKAILEERLSAMAAELAKARGSSTAEAPAAPQGDESTLNDTKSTIFEGEDRGEAP
eukprot:GSA25T00011225001.1